MIMSYRANFRFPKKAHHGKLWEALKKTTNCRSAALIISLCSKGSLLILLTSNVMAILLSLHTNGLQFLFQSLVFALCGLQGHQRTFQVLGFRDGKFAYGKLTNHSNAMNAMGSRAQNDARVARQLMASYFDSILLDPQLLFKSCKACLCQTQFLPMLNQLAQLPETSNSA